jgi:hypothetical protein
MAGGIRHADHVAPSIRTSWQSLRRQAAVGIVRSRTQTIEFSFSFFIKLHNKELHNLHSSPNII